jgi:hypothetical protein
MSSKFRELLEDRIHKEALDCSSNHMVSRNDSQHETGWAKGRWNAFKDVLEWSQEIERQLNNA